MGRTLRKLLSHPAPIHPDQARFIRRSNLEEALPGIPEQPKDIQKLDREVQAQAKEHFQDAQDYSSWPLTPVGLTQDVVEGTGTGRAARVANRSLWGSLTEDPRWTNKLNNTLTGNAPTTIYRRAVSTAPEVSASLDNEPLMGTSDRTAVTKITPWKLLDGITGNTQHSDRVMTRIANRNTPHGGGGAAVYHLDDLEKEWNRDWLLFRGMDDGFSGARQGFASPISKQIYHNVADDPYVGGGGGFNVGQHEAIHSILDAVNPSRNFQVQQLTRPAVLDRKWQLGPNSSYLGSDATELSNLMFHLKRQTEITRPGMRDVGFDRNATDNFIDFVRNYEATGSDPRINLPGHRQIDQPAHGYEQGMQKLQAIIDAAGPDGLEDIKDINFKTGSTNPSLRTALLS
jgi:hypothetical protein